MIRELVSPILDLFEAGEEGYHYRQSYRLILKVVGIMGSDRAVAKIWGNRLQDKEKGE